MKSLKHIALFLSCLVIASCTKDIDEKEPSNECSILDIQLTGQLGKATIERVDDNQGTVTLYIFEQADYPWEAVGVEALALSAYATADVSDGDTLDFRNPERKARIIVRSQTGKQVLWTVYLKPYDPFYVGTWAVSDIKIYLDQNISGNGTGKWDTSMGGSAGCVGRYAGQQFLQQLLAQFVQVLVYRTGRRIGRTWPTLTTGLAVSRSGC